MKDIVFSKIWTLSLALFIVALNGFAQEPVVDKTRLEYTEESIESLQVGMAVSGDQQLVAFLLDNGQLQILDVKRSSFRYSYQYDLEDPKEIMFTKDDQYILLVEGKRVRVLDWKNGNVLTSQSYAEEIQIVRASTFSPHFAVADETTVGIWDLSSMQSIQSIKISQRITVIDFSPFAHEMTVGPAWSALRNRYYVYDYLTGKQLEEVKRRYIPSYDNLEKRMIYYTNSSMGVPGFGHKSFDQNDFQLITVIDGKQEKSSDVGFYITTLHIKDKLLAAAGYRGFSVFDYNKGGRVFTTKKTKRERSSAGINAFRDYIVNAHYQLSEDLVLVNAYGDNINQIYSATQNQIIGYIFVDAGGDLAIVSRDGRFDGTERSSAKLFWTSRKSLRKTSLESTFNRGFTPGLLPILMNDSNVSEELAIDDESIDLIPVIKITGFNGKKVASKGIPKLSSNQKSVSVDVSVVENTSNAASIKLFQNNKLVGIAEGTTTASFGVNLTNTFGEENYFFAVAESKDGIESEKQKMIVDYTGNPDAKPKLFLVSIGVDEYRNPKYNLNYAIADANAFTEVIQAGASSIFEEIQTLEIRNADFTKAGVRSALEKVKDQANEQDLLVFYYAGHGVMSEGLDRASEFFLVPHDITQLYGRDDMLFEKAISASELQQLSKEINAQKQLFIIDACQSASALEALAQRGVKEERAIAQLARSTGTFWITASGSEQFATEFESLGHGVFTYALLEGLSGKADGANQDKKITVKELSAFVESRVPELSEQYKGKPQFPSGYSFGNDFPIVLYE